MSIDGVGNVKSQLRSATASQAQPPQQGRAREAQGRESVQTVEAPAAVEKRKPQPVVLSAPHIEAVTAQIDQYLKSVARTLEFRVDDSSGRMVVSVRDSATGDLIRQFPNEEILHLAEMAQEQTIVLVNEKA